MIKGILCQQTEETNLQPNPEDFGLRHNHPNHNWRRGPYEIKKVTVSFGH